MISPAFRLVVGIVLLFSSSVRAAELTVAAAANVKFALDELVTVFHTNQTDIRVKVTYGSSGNFFAQLQNRAPFDLFLSADMEYAEKLAEAGLALDTNVFPYAVGRIVVWTRTNSTVDVQNLGMQALLDPAVKKIAIANPRVAPYGQAAVAAMNEYKVYEEVKAKLVLGENISQTAQFVQSGAADVGIIALSLALAPPTRAEGRYWEIPSAAHPNVRQGGIILRWSKEPDAAREFRDFLRSEPAVEVLKRYGYGIPKG